MSNLQNSWELVKASGRVLLQDKSLIVFPVISVVLSIVLIVSFLMPLAFMPALHEAMDGPSGSIVTAGLAFLFYVLEYFIIFFANAALVGATTIRLRGGTPSVGAGLRIAASRTGSIFVYAMISATVGMVLRAIAERAGFIGRIIVSLLGAAWGIATFLAVPVLVNEQVGPVDAIKRSMDLLKRSWGEQLVAGAGINIVFNWLTFFSILLFLGGFYVTGVLFQSPAAGLPFYGLLFFWIVGLSLLRATLSGIFSAALYRFAAEGDAGSAFEPRLIQGAFAPKVRT